MSQFVNRRRKLCGEMGGQRDEPVKQRTTVEHHLGVSCSWHLGCGGDGTLLKLVDQSVE